LHSIRIFAASLVVALVVAAGGAVAQTSDQTGQPLKLLAGLRPPHEAKARERKANVHAKIAHKTTHTAAAKNFAVRTRVAGKKHGKIVAAQSEPVPTQTTPIAPPANAWPTGNTAAPASTPETAPADNAPRQSSVTVGGQTVQVDSPNQVNELDLAARDNNAAAPSAALSDRPDVATAAQTALAAPVHADAGQNVDTVGSVSWIAQVLAAFGGAVAAGAVAWFLIGSGPVRIYG
jgi:hypothetical protein